MTSLRALLNDPHFRRGARDMLDFAPGIAAWGLVTGVAMAKSGLSMPLAVLMTLTVYAGSAQLASLPLLAAGAPMWVVWAAAFCVNLRFVIFSAQWRVHMGHLSRGRRMAIGYLLADLNLIAFQRAWPGAKREPGQVRYIVGGIATIWFTWQIPSLFGIFLSEAIPTQWGLGFAGTLAMLGLTYGLLNDRSTWTAAAVAGAAAVATFAMPLKLNIVVAIAAAVAAGLLIDQAERAGQREEGRHMTDGWLGAVTILGLAVVTFVARNFFLFPDREVKIPAWLQRGLKVAPLAALAAVVVPEVIMTQGKLIATWQDARLPAVAAASLYYLWRPGVLGPLLAGLAVFLPLRLLWGW